MKTLLSKLIHILIMPCSRVPMLIEQRNAGKLSFKKKIRLHIHLFGCKWCAAYALKVEQIDRLLSKKLSEERKKISLNDSEIQNFKEIMKKKIEK